MTRKSRVRTAVGSNPTLDSLVAVRNSSPGQPEPCEGNLVAAAGSCGGLMVKHPWPLLEISLSDFRRLATLNIYTYLPTYLPAEISLFQAISTIKLLNSVYKSLIDVCLQLERALLYHVLSTMDRPFLTIAIGLTQEPT